MSDLNFQDLSTVQNGLQPAPRTIAAAATIAPTTFLTKISGTTQITTITPPVTGTHMLKFIAGATNSFALTTGNLVGGTTAASTTLPTTLLYDPTQGKYLVEA